MPEPPITDEIQQLWAEGRSGGPDYVSPIFQVASGDGGGSMLSTRASIMTWNMHGPGVKFSRRHVYLRVAKGAVVGVCKEA